ncbi:MAG: hypothetical protein HYZ47_05350, partial [Simkania negevensis]|nr:hypothetical protein [Simkania negevensis]
IIFYYFLLRKGRLLEKEKSNSSKEEVKESKKEELGEGFKLVFSSRALKFILLIVVLMQFSTTIVEYQFNTFLAKILPNQDVRTEYYGRLWGIVNTLKVCIQFFASFLLIQFLGLRRTHFVLPGILLANTCLCLLVPQFAIFAYSFTLIKTFYYSLFNVLKEMLYLPLSKREKFKAKAVIDIFAYRSAKALASLFVIGLEFFCPLHLPYAFSWGPFFFFLLWLFGVYQMFKPEKEGAIA